MKHKVRLVVSEIGCLVPLLFNHSLYTTFFSNRLCLVLWGTFIGVFIVTLVEQGTQK